MHLGCPSPPTPPPKCITRSCFSFLLGITAFPREIENNAYAKFGRQTSCIMGDVQVANTNSRSETFPNDPSFSMLATQSWRTKDFKIPATSCSSFASFLPYFNKKFRFRLQWKVNGNLYARLLLSFTLLLSGVFLKLLPFPAYLSFWPGGIDLIWKLLFFFLCKINRDWRQSKTRWLKQGYRNYMVG